MELNSGNTQHYRDESSSMAIHQIIDLPVTAWESSDDELYFGYTKDSVWLRFPVESIEFTRVFLTEHHGIDQFDVWILKDESLQPVFLGSSGWSVKGSREESQANQSFSTVPIRLEKDSSSTLFIRAQSTSSLSLNFLLFDRDEYLQSIKATSIVQGLGLGSSLMMAVFALIIMISSRRREFVYFFFLVLITFLLSLYVGGFGPLSVWKNFPEITIIAGLTSSLLMFIIIIRFFRSILDLKDFSGYRRWLISAEYISYLAIIIALSVPRNLGFQIVSYASLVMIIYLQVLLILGAVLRMRYSKYLLMAWSTTLIAGLYQLMSNLGVFPYIPNVYNPGFFFMFAFLIQNAILGGTIVVQSEMSIVDERLLRVTAEHQVKATRERLIQTDRMSGLASMVSSIAHEIATPVGNARMLGSEIEARSHNLGAQLNRGELSKAELDDFFEFSADSGSLIVQTLSHAGSIMEGFKEVAADKATLKQKTIDPREYFTRLERILSPRIRRSGHKLKVEIDSDKPLQTIPGYVTQVVDNLVNNAIKHAFPEGEKGRVEIDVIHTVDNSLEITVSDNGQGIQEDILPHIFERFYTTLDDKGGTGLGLAISKMLAEEYLYGSLKCITRMGEGSRFVFCIADLSKVSADHSE
ncbi:MAG: sensor histidine kinase [Spirochaetaceae bacterium]|nr:sensor histidine kinase [Spirochaetaceae bacterium]